MKWFSGSTLVRNEKRGIRLVNLFKLCCVVSLCAITLALFPLALEAQEEDADSNHRLIHEKSGAITATQQQLNTLIALEATHNEIGSFSLQLGGPVSGTWSGTVSDTGWSLTFSGTINGQDASITENGVIKKKDVLWTDSGTIGGSAITGNGNVTVKGTEVVGSQNIGFDTPGAIPELQLVTWTEVVECIANPSNCLAIDLTSTNVYWWNGAAPIEEAFHLHKSSGTIWGMAAEQTTLDSMAAVGMLSSTGEISYNVGSLPFAGSGVLRSALSPTTETQPASHHSGE
jgi:hypothetical protein